MNPSDQLPACLPIDKSREAMKDKMKVQKILVSLYFAMISTMIHNWC